MFQLMLKLKWLKLVIKELNKGKYSDVEKKCEEAQQKLIALQIQIQQHSPNAQLPDDEKLPA